MILGNMPRSLIMEMVRGEMSGVSLSLASVMVIMCKKLERLNIEPCACFSSFISPVRLSPALTPSSCALEQSLWYLSRLCLELEVWDPIPPSVFSVP